MFEKDSNNVVRVLDTYHFGRPKNKAFVVYAMKDGGYFGNPFGKAFKSKPQALKFAKSYMKKHNQC